MPLSDSRVERIELSRTKERPEHPERLHRFLKAMDGTDWKKTDDALECLFIALNGLVYPELVYYYRARRRQHWFSSITRGLAILLGTAGILAPLLAAANSTFFAGWAAYGYPLLASAAAMLLVNRHFGVTGGHIRFV